MPEFYFRIYVKNIAEHSDSKIELAVFLDIISKLLANILIL